MFTKKKKLKISHFKKNLRHFTCPVSVRGRENPRFSANCGTRKMGTHCIRHGRVGQRGDDELGEIMPRLIGA